MAQIGLRRRLVNSGERKAAKMARAKRKGPRKMTAKQIRFFGSARQKAALRLKKSRGSHKHRNGGTRKKRNYGTVLGRSWSHYSRETAPKPKRRARAKGKGRKGRRKNVGQIISVALGALAGNPGTRKHRRRKNSGSTARRKGAGKMARRRKSYKRRANTSHRRRRTVRAVYSHRRRNTGRRRARGYTHRRRRNAGGGISTATGMVKNALGVIGGAVATRYATQLVLGGKNTGAIGYIGNAIAALVLGWGAGKLFKNPQLGTMIMLGGFTGLTLRLIQDLTPIGQYVNLQLAGLGKAGDSGIGLITDTTFYVPTVFQPGSMTNALIPSQLQAAIAAAGARGMRGLGDTNPGNRGHHYAYGKVKQPNHATPITPVSVGRGRALSRVSAA